MTFPKLLQGKKSTDKRGEIKFVNDFNFKNIKRFYEVEHKNITPRAFHGHFKEAKYVFVASGRALVCLVKLSKNLTNDKNPMIHKYILESNNPQVLYIPPGYANGFKVLSKNTKLIFFSTLTLEQSKKDDCRYPYDQWGKEIWKI